MKKIKINSILVFILFIIMISVRTTYSYNVDVINPRPCPENFSFMHHPENVLECKFVIQRFHIFDSDTILYKVYMEQNGYETLINEGYCRGGEEINLSVNLQQYPHLCYNEKAAIRVEARRFDNFGVTFSGRGYFVKFKDGLNCRYISRTNGATEILNTQFIPVTFFNSCGGLASGTYLVRRYKTTFTLYGNFEDSIPVLESSLCLGYTGAGPNNQQYWAGITEFTPTQIKIVTFTYIGYNLLGQSFNFQPCRPDQATITYRMVRKPVLLSISMFPMNVTPVNNIAYFRSNLLRGNGNVSFEWKDSNSTSVPFVSEYNYNRARVKFNFFSSVPDRLTEDRAFYVFSRAANEADTTPWLRKKLRVGNASVQCPVISAEENSDYLQDNSVLLTSYSEPGKFVKDFLMLENPFLEGKTELNMKISESALDETRLDFISIKQINVNTDEYVSVTSTGDVIVYKLSSQKTKILKNDSEDISDALMYDDDKSVDLKKGDKLKLELPPGESSYIVLRTFGPEEKESTAGYIKTDGGYSEKFYSHDNPGTICYKLKSPFYNEIYIELEQNVSFGQIAVVNNLNTGTKRDLILSSAYNGKSRDVINIIRKPDGEFIKISEGNDLLMKFENKITPDGKKSYYLCVTEGEIIKTPDKGNCKNESESAIVIKNNLSANSPNPFNPLTKFSYEIITGSFVKISVYDISGREVKTMVNEYKSAGKYEVVFDGTVLSSGVYFYRMETSAGFRDTKKMTMIK